MPRSFLITNKRYRADIAAEVKENLESNVLHTVTVTSSVEPEPRSPEARRVPDPKRSPEPRRSPVLCLTERPYHSPEAWRPMYNVLNDVPQQVPTIRAYKNFLPEPKHCDRPQLHKDLPMIPSPCEAPALRLHRDMSSPSDCRREMPSPTEGVRPLSSEIPSPTESPRMRASFIRDLPSPMEAEHPLMDRYTALSERSSDLAAYLTAALPALETKTSLMPPSPQSYDMDGHKLTDIRGVPYNIKELVERAWSEIDCMGEDFVCPDCGKRYSTSSNLARHRQTHRSVTDKKARKCPHCEKVYVSMPAYSMHVRTHNQGCECSFCGKRFSRPWLLQGHIRTHTGEKPFKCPKCGKAFADKSNLRAHVQTHSTDKPYICGRCGKAFALKSYLYKHEESSCMRGQRYTRNH